MQTPRLALLVVLIALLAQACTPGGAAPPTALPSAPPPTATTAAAAATVAATATVAAPDSPSTAPPAATQTALPTVTAVLTAAAVPTAAPTAHIPPTGPLSRAALVEALRGGGYIIYFRHGATTPIPDDADPVVLDDCATQRMLSPAGQEQARAIGEAFQRLGIPVGRVLSSPFCRALDTARLAFGKAEIEPLLENLETSPDDAEREKRTAGLRGLLSTPPAPAMNTILVAHGFNLSAATQVTVPEGGAAVFRPDGAGGFERVATITPEEWATLQGSNGS